MYLSSRLTLSSETLDLAVGADLVVLEDGHLDLLPLVLDLLGGGLCESAQESQIALGSQGQLT